MTLLSRRIGYIEDLLIEIFVLNLFNELQLDESSREKGY